MPYKYVGYLGEYEGQHISTPDFVKKKLIFNEEAICDAA